MGERVCYCVRWLLWRYNLAIQSVIFLSFVNYGHSIYHPGQGFSLPQSAGGGGGGGGADTLGFNSGWNPPTQQEPVTPRAAYDLSLFTHGGSKKAGASALTKTASSKLLKGEGGGMSTFNLFVKPQQPSPSVNTLHHQQPPSKIPTLTTTTNNNKNIIQQPNTPSSSHLLLLLQALRSRVKNMIPAPAPTTLPMYLTHTHNTNNHNNHNNYLQPPQPFGYQPANHFAMQPALPTQPSTLSMFQQPQSLLLQAPIPPKRPVPPIPPQQPMPMHQHQHQQQPHQMLQQNPPPQSQYNRPPPMQNNQPPPAQRPPPPRRYPAQTRSSYYNAYRYNGMWTGSECSGFAAPGQLCCDGILNIPPKGSSPRQLVCCSKTYFDPTTHVCCGDMPVPKPAKGPPQMCCGHMLYNPRTHICCDKFPMPNQGGTIKCCKKRTYNPATQMCCGESTKPRLPEHKGMDCCGKHMYNPATHLCCDEGNTFLKRPGVNCCGKTLYTPAMQSCCFGDAVPKGGFCYAK